MLSLVLGSLVIWCSSYIFNNDANLYYSHFEPERFLDLTLTRYGAVPAMMLASMVPLAVGVLLERRPALMPLGVGVVVGLAVVMSLNFVQRDNHRSGVPWSCGGRCGAGGVLDGCRDGGRSYPAGQLGGAGAVRAARG